MFDHNIHCDHLYALLHLQFFRIFLKREHIVAVVLPVTTGFPQLLIKYQRCFYGNIATLSTISLSYHERVYDRDALPLEPKWSSWCVVMEHKQSQFLTQLTVVSLLRLFQTEHVGIQLFFARPNSPIHTL